MLPKVFICIFFTVISSFAYAQDVNYLDSSTIPNDLRENADAVIRKNEVQITIKNYDSYEITTDRIVTVLNKSGLSDVDAYENYDNFSEVDDIRVTIYDKTGDKIVKFKEDDFKDKSAVGSGTLYSDNRVKYLDYTPPSFPITLHYKSRVEHSSSAFLPGWYPVEGFKISTEFSKYVIENTSGEELKIKRRNLEEFAITEEGNYVFTARNLVAIRSQAHRPSFSSFTPSVSVALKKFQMKGVDGVNENWESFGKWMYDNLFVDVGEVPQELKAEIKKLTATAQTQREKAEIVYNFMQDRSRYISVQVGLGGWKPIDATEVHEKSYGDCKGLSNYTRALLKEVGIEAEYVIIYGGENMRNIDKDFSATQGNHMILYIPQLDDEKDFWLECTSKSNPFGYIAGFTDDRDALVVNENGGRIMHTTKYSVEDSKQVTLAQIKLESTGKASGSLSMKTTGYQYSLRDYVAKTGVTDMKKAYQRRWSNLNGFVVTDISNINDKKNIEFTEEVRFKVEKLANSMGDLLLMNAVFFNQSTYEPSSYKERFYDIELSRGYQDVDEYVVSLPENIKVDALPDPVKIDSDFGKYELKIELQEGNKLKIYRLQQMNTGSFEKSRYDEYVAFREAIVKADDSKAVLKISKS